MSRSGSRASSAQSERLLPARPDRSSPTPSSSQVSDESSLNKLDPLPPIGGTAAPATSEEIAGTMAGGKMNSGKGRRPRITNGFRRETDDDSLSGSDDPTSTSPSQRKAPDAKTAKVAKDSATMETQTEWSWLEDMQMMQKLKAGKHSRLSTHSDTTPRSSREEIHEDSFSGDSMDEEPDKPKLVVTFAEPDGKDSVVDSELKGVPKSKMPGEGRNLESEMTFASESSIPYPSRDDEYGIPILALSSESEDSDSEEEFLYPKEGDDGTLPSIGPPEILKYQKESDKDDLPMEGPEGMSEEEKARMKALGGEGVEGGMFEGTCEFCGNPIKPFPTMDEQKYRPPEDLYCCNEYQEFVLYMIKHPIEQEHLSDKKIDVKPHPPYGSKQARRMAKEKALQRMREREMARQQQAMAAAGAGGGGATFYQFARQMKTINYQLSSQKCLEEGWTVLPSDGVDEKELEPEIFEPEPMPPPWADSEEKKARSAGLIQKFYPDGSLFVVLFEDGTGTVFYPSGRVAITITSIEQGLYTYIIQRDSDSETISGVFEPNGVASSHYSNGSLRIFMDPIGGVELDAHGRRKRKWNWKDWRINHVHAPPIQPISFSLTPQIGIRITSQENMTLTYTCKQRSVRFQVGAKLRLVAKELVPRPGVEEDDLYRQEISNRVQSLFNKVANLLKFPNSPKLHKLPSPAHVSAKAQRLERIREEQAGGKKFSSVVTVN